MRIRHAQDRDQDRIVLQMTPMIDVVFQLLVFFVMSFKIVTQEGDFNVKMPQAAPSGVPRDQTVPPMKLRLTAAADGGLAGIQLNDRTFTNFGDLHRHIIGIVGDDQPGAFRESAEIEIDADFPLRYEYTIAAITAVTGYRTAEGDIVKLIEKIRFSPAKQAGQGSASSPPVPAAGPLD